MKLRKPCPKCGGSHGDRDIEDAVVFTQCRNCEHRWAFRAVKPRKADPAKEASIQRALKLLGY